MTNKIFVGGLSWGCDEDMLKTAFEPFGEVLESRVITDRETGRSRGFGFVTFSNADEANAAVEQMDGKEIDNRAVKVNIAEDKRRNNNRGGGFQKKW